MVGEWGRKDEKPSGMENGVYVFRKCGIGLFNLEKKNKAFIFKWREGPPSCCKIHICHNLMGEEMLLSSLMAVGKRTLGRSAFIFPSWDGDYVKLHFS